MSRALAIIAVLLLAAAAVAPLADAASAESIPFVKEIAGGASAIQGAGEEGASAVAGAGQTVDPDPASGIKADPAPARR